MSIELIEEPITKLADALLWFIENDETNRGGEWEEVNAYWIAGLNRGIDALSFVYPIKAKELRYKPENFDGITVD